MNEYSDYRVLVYDSRERLEREVRTLENEGYVRDGDVMVDTVNGGNSYSQNMYKVAV